MHTSTARGLTSEPNIIPMIDILLVLIISSMIPFLFPPQKLLLQLPQPAGTSSAEAAIRLKIDPGPRYSVNGRSIEATRLVPELAAIFRDRPRKILFIDADRRVRYQDVFWAWGLVRGAGITVTAIVPGDTTPAPR